MEKCKVLHQSVCGLLQHNYAAQDVGNVRSLSMQRKPAPTTNADFCDLP